MNVLVRLASAANLPAGATLTIILAGMLAEGANTPPAAALLSGALVFALLLVVSARPSEGVLRVMAANRVTIFAAGMFVFLAALSTVPLSGHVQTIFANPLAESFHETSVAASLAPTSTLEGIVAFLGPSAGFMLGALATADRTRSTVSLWLCAFTVVLALYSLWSFFSEQAPLRLDGRIGSANAAAALFGALALFADVRVVHCGSLASRNKALPSISPTLAWLFAPLRAPLATSAFTLAIACALLTASRGGLAATAIGFGVFAALLSVRAGGPSRFLVAGPALALAAMGLWLIILGNDQVLSRLGDVSEALAGRQELLAPHWSAFIARPLTGHGLNTFHELNAMAQTPENWPALSIAGATHNIYVQALEETGLIGLGLFSLMLAPPLWRALVSALNDNSAPYWGAGVYAASFLFLIHGVMDFALQIPAIGALFAFCLGAFSPLAHKNQ